jgi:hypothetical protein
MGFHSFSLDPRTVLGVGPEASLAEIHEAYRLKSKKHHPDMGGDEWAFRMVARAYEVLKATAAVQPSQPWGRPQADVMGRDWAPDRAGTWSRPFSASDATTVPPSGPSRAEESSRQWPGNPDRDDLAGSVSRGEAGTSPAPSALRTVNVELIWTRFEKDGSTAPLLSSPDADAATLSVYMVISWPPEELVDRTAEFSSAGEILRILIDLFERLRRQSSVVAARSRIEDGRFVGWLSYPDVLTAQDAFLTLRETFRTQGLNVKLQTRDERIPFDWHSAGHQSVLPQAS